MSLGIQNVHHTRPLQTTAAALGSTDKDGSTTIALFVKMLGRASNFSRTQSARHFARHRQRRHMGGGGKYVDLYLSLLQVWEFYVSHFVPSMAAADGLKPTSLESAEENSSELSRGYGFFTDLTRMELYFWGSSTHGTIRKISIEPAIFHFRCYY